MDILRRAGLHDLAECLGQPAGPPPWETDPFDPVAMRRGQATRYLETHRNTRRFGTPSIDYPKAVTWVHQVLAGDPRVAPMLLAIGPTGTGKSRLGWAILSALKQGRAEQGRGLDCWMIGYADFNAQCRPAPDEAHVEAFQRYADADFLVFDDMGATRTTEWTEENLYRLFDHRWMERLPTVVATNLSTAKRQNPGETSARNDLERAVGDRVASRVMDATIIVLTGEDRRLADARERRGNGANA